jgi:transposase
MSVEPHIIQGWFPVGCHPTIKYAWSRDKFFVLGGLSTSSFNAKIADELNAHSYLGFLSSLLRKYKRCIIIIDGAKYHFEKSKVRTFYESHKDRLKVIQLPPYSPNLNPIEQVWKKIKKWLATKIWFTKEDLEKHILFALNNPHFMSPMYDYLCT